MSGIFNSKNALALIGVGKAVQHLSDLTSEYMPGAPPSSDTVSLPGSTAPNTPIAVDFPPTIQTLVQTESATASRQMFDPAIKYGKTFIKGGFLSKRDFNSLRQSPKYVAFTSTTGGTNSTAIGLANYVNIDICKKDEINQIFTNGVMNHDEAYTADLGGTLGSAFEPLEFATCTNDATDRSTWEKAGGVSATHGIAIKNMETKYYWINSGTKTLHFELVDWLYKGKNQYLNQSIVDCLAYGINEYDQYAENTSPTSNYNNLAYDPSIPLKVFLGSKDVKDNYIIVKKRNITLGPGERYYHTVNFPCKRTIDDEWNRLSTTMQRLPYITHGVLARVSGSIEMGYTSSDVKTCPVFSKPTLDVYVKTRYTWQVLDYYGGTFVRQPMIPGTLATKTKGYKDADMTKEE